MILIVSWIKGAIMSLFPKFCWDVWTPRQKPFHRQSPTGRFVSNGSCPPRGHRSLGVLFAHQVRTRSHRDPSRTCLLCPHSSRAATARSPPPLFTAGRKFQVLSQSVVLPTRRGARMGGGGRWKMDTPQQLSFPISPSRVNPYLLTP